MKILLNVLVSAIAVYVTVWLLPGAEITSLGDTLIVAIVLGIVNMFVKPVISVLTLPITILTLGLFSLVVNALIILLVDWLVPGFTVDGFLWALAFALVLSMVNAFFNKITN
ncbi:MAG: phage holin family protein [Patescibacteria group bacterium]|nr:phage holin family protein [Patescibacteria group bacterium]